jgi:hypothetical protein
MRPLHAIALLAATAAAPSALAAPRSIADCEKIEAALAYNQCLASFGPAAGHGGGGSYHPALQSAAPTFHAAAGGRRHAATDLSAATHSGARVHMEFIPRH